MLVVGSYQESTMALMRDHWIRMGVLEEEEWGFKYWRFVDEDTKKMIDRLNAVRPDTPPLSAQDTLPDRDQCSESVFWCRLFLRWIEARKPYAVGEEINELQLLKADTERRLAIWDKIRDCRAYYSSSAGKRQLLTELRDMVGQEAFDNRQYPNPLPDAAYNSEWRLDADEHYSDQ